MAEKFKNNVNATLASSITAASVTIALSSGDGDQFPVIASGTADTFRISLWDKSGNVEIISICRRESGSDTLYVGTSTAHQAAGNVAGRGMEGTTALAVTSSDYHVIKMSVTAAQIEAACEVSTLGGLTATVAELNSVCDANTATAAELSELHSGGAVNADFVKLHALTASASEINAVCDNATITAEKLNKVVYGAAEAVLRIIKVVIAYYDSNECQITITSLWNGDSLSPTRHSSKVAYYDFNCTGNCLGVVGVFLTNGGGEVFPNARPWAASFSNNLRISICPTIGGSYGLIGDILSSLGQSVTFTVAYLTSE